MAVYTCDACLYTFSAESFPERCPDCGKESVTRRLSVDGRTIIRSYPAVRPATEAEIAQYEAVQAEIAEEEAAAREAERQAFDLKELSEKLERYQMTQDERNFSMVFWFELHNCPREHLIPILDRTLGGGDPEWRLSFYRDLRREFTSKVNQDRLDLENAGLSEPLLLSDSDWEDSETDIEETDENQSGFSQRRFISPNQAGPALQLLYRFKRDELSELFGDTPNLGNLRRIDLKKIAEEPGAEFLRFLADWRNSLVS